MRCPSAICATSRSAGTGLRDTSKHLIIARGAANIERFNHALGPHNGGK